MNFKYIFILSLILTMGLYGQSKNNKHIVGPSVGFSFLGSSPQFGINHEYSLNISDIGIDGLSKMSIGGIFRYLNYSDESINVYRDYFNIIIGLQNNYYFYMPNDDLEPYVGLILAYDIGYTDTEIKTTGFIDDNEKSGGFWIGANAGVRYWAFKNFAIGLRIGFGIKSYAFIDLGIDYRLN